MGITFSPTNKIIGLTDEGTITLEVIETPLVSDETRAASSSYDVIFDVVTPLASKNNARVSTGNLDINDIPYGKSSDESIATIDSNLNIVHVADGDVEFYVGAKDKGEKRIKRTMTSLVGLDFGDVKSYVIGSLSAHIKANVDTLISGLTPGSTYQKFWASNNGDHLSPNATMNSNLFANSFDFSGVCCISSRQPDERYAPALVSNQHALVADHIFSGGFIQVGDTHIFKRTDGTYQTAIISDITSVTRTMLDGVTTATPDLAVVYYDRVITGCNIYNTMPIAWAETYCTSLTDRQASDLAFPAVITNSLPSLRKAMHNTNGSWESYLQICSASSAELSGIDYTSWNKYKAAIYNSSQYRKDTVNNNTWDWGITSIPGDSGGASFLIINGELVLLCSQQFSSGSADISIWTSEVNTIMDTQAGAVSGTYILNHPDLTAFTSY